MAAIEVQVSSTPSIEITHERLSIGGSVRVKNSDETFDNTYQETDSPVTLPDITVTQPDGSTTTQPSLTDVVCNTPDPVQIQVNAVNTATATAGDTYDQQVHDSTGVDVGTSANPCVIADSDIQVNGVFVTRVRAEQTHNQLIQDTIGTSVGTAANPSVISDSSITVHSTPVGTVRAEQSYDFRVKDSAGTNIGTHANPSIVADTTIRNQANDWNDTEVAEGTYTLGLQRIVDSDGSNVDTVDYKPIASGAAFTCTPADYGTRILSVLRREHCVDALCGFSFRYIEDEFADAANAVCRIRRSSDNAEADFTPSEITDGTLTTWTGANDGHVVKWYDQTGNYFELFNLTAGNQAKLVTAGVLNTDAQGNPTCITTSTFGYEIGANGGNSSRLTLFSPSGAFWSVGTKNNSTSISRAISNAGNPAVGIADTTTFQNANGTGNPIAIVNGSVLANDQRTTLQTAINNVEHALFMHSCDWTASGNWRTGQGILAFQAYPIGSQISEFVLDKKDWSSATLVSLINSDLQTYFGYW